MTHIEQVPGAQALLDIAREKSRPPLPPIIERIHTIRGLATRIAAACGITRQGVALWRDLPADRVETVERVYGLRLDQIPPLQHRAAILARAGVKDISGQRFGRLVAVEPVARTKLGWSWLTHCDCGATPVVAGFRLRNRDTKSCGCIRRGLRAREADHA